MVSIMVAHPVKIVNNTGTAVSNYQQMVVAPMCNNCANASVSNIFWAYDPAGASIIPSWLESQVGSTVAPTNANSGSLIYWLNIAGTISAGATQTVYMIFADRGTTVWDGTLTGVAPQWTSTYGQYDNGANVFLNYFSGASLSGWTVSGTAGQTTSAPSGSPFGANAFYALNSVGSYLYTIANGQSTNMIIEYYTYINRLNDVFFLVNSNGAGQLSRQGNGNGWYGIASTSSWTSWSAPPKTGSWTGWVMVGVVVNNGVATEYLSTTLGNYGSEIGSNPSNQYTVANNGNYLGLVGDGGGSSNEYWNGIIIRAYPPNGVMPAVLF